MRPDSRPNGIHSLDVAWVLFAAGNIYAVAALDSQVPTPFHLVWLSLTLLYGVRLWSLRTTVTVTLLVSLCSGAALSFAIMGGRADSDEYAEIPLMAMLFAVMVWHARRRQVALRAVHQLSDERKHLFELQVDFARDASHELRTPITIARGHVDLARETVTDPQAVADLDIVTEELVRLARISERLLIVAAAQHPEFLVRVDVDVRAMVADVVARWRSVADRAWALVVTSDLVVVADPDRLRYALDALVENAVAFTDEGGLVLLRARSEGPHVAIELDDDGPGIAPADRDRIWERFARGGVARQPGTGGSGLGLPAVKAIVEAHGGSLACRARPGGGTRFTVLLPGAPVAARGAEDTTPALVTAAVG